MYILVEYTDEKNVAVIPESWLEGCSCAVWPNNIKTPGKLMKAVLEKVRPDDSWPAYPIRELYRNESYVEVRKRLRRAEEESDLATTTDDPGSDEEVRKSRRKRRMVDFSDSEQEPEINEMHTPQTTAKQPTKSYSISPARKGLFGQKGPQSLQTGYIPITPRAINTSSPSVNIDTASRSRHQEGRFEARVFTMLERVAQNEEKILFKLGKLEEKMESLRSFPSSSTTNGACDLPDTIKFPAATIEELVLIEEQLSESSVFQSLVNYLCMLGGRSLGDSTRRALRYVVTNDLARNYNWHGKKGKKPFGNLKICRAVQKAILKGCEGTVSQFENETREWLRTASDRDGGRKRREKSVAEARLPAASLSI